jgi:hypothetical protein
MKISPYQVKVVEYFIINITLPPHIFHVFSGKINSFSHFKCRYSEIFADAAFAADAIG